MEEYGNYNPNEAGNGQQYNNNEVLPEPTGSKVHKDVKAVNIVFLAIVLLPQILIELGVGNLIEANYTANLIFSQAVYVAPVLVYLFFFKKSAKPCRFKKIKISDILLCLLMYICMYPVLLLLNAVSMLYSVNRIGNVVMSISSEIPLAVGILVVALIPAFCEELTYRGVFYNTYRETNPLAAIFLSGALFGLLHGNLNQITYAVVLGCFFALVVEATDSIFSSMFVHGLVNSFSTLLIYLLPKAIQYVKDLLEEAKAAGDTQTIDMLTGMIGSEDLSLESSYEAASAMSADQVMSLIMAYLFPAAIGGFLAFMLFRFVAKRNGRWEYICDIFKHPRKNGKLFTWPLVVDLILLAGLIVLNELSLRGILN
ncbi:MAG: CPBP family intramembrane metalloprotease [Lachnospiraceae bacterium]|nr:CPBP family intramembrane metalloprotease [Lachnospiraceae bacterium]